MTSNLNTLIEVVAHRGSGTGFVQPKAPPENTLPAFHYAWQTGADACELDVHLTRDQQLIVIHDETTGRTANLNLKVSDYDLACLQQLDAGGWKGKEWTGVRFPSLSEALETVPRGKRLFIELKTGPAIVPSLKTVLDQSSLASEQLVIISFNINTLYESKKVLPQYPHYFIVVYEWSSDAGQWNVVYDITLPGHDFLTAWETPADTNDLIRMLKEGHLDGLDVSITRPDEVSLQMRNENMDWAVWTVDQTDAALAAAVKGAFAITTNKTTYIQGVLKSHGIKTGPKS